MIYLFADSRLLSDSSRPCYTKAFNCQLSDIMTFVDKGEMGTTCLTHLPVEFYSKLVNLSCYGKFSMKSSKIGVKIVVLYM